MLNVYTSMYSLFYLVLVYCTFNYFEFIKYVPILFYYYLYILHKENRKCTFKNFNYKIIIILINVNCHIEHTF